MHSLHNKNAYIYKKVLDKNMNKKNIYIKIQQNKCLENESTHNLIKS